MFTNSCHLSVNGPRFKSACPPVWDSTFGGIKGSVLTFSSDAVSVVFS